MSPQIWQYPKSVISRFRGRVRVWR